MTADAPTLLATGRIVGHAPSTANFIRAQHARGVSVETLRRQLKIKAEHVLELLAHAPEPPLPKVDLAKTPHHLPSGGWGARKPASPLRVGMPPSSAGLSKVEIIRRAMEDRERATRLAKTVIPVVAKVARFNRDRIVGPDKTDAAKQIRAMVFALMHELDPTCPLIAVAWAVGGRQANVVERSLERCSRSRQISAAFNSRYLEALARLAT